MKSNVCLRAVAVLAALAIGVAPAVRAATTTTTAKTTAPGKAKAAVAQKPEKAEKSEKAEAVKGVEHEEALRHERRVGEEVVLVGTRRVGNTDGAQLLREAYHLLAVADHDYDGHRARAMHNTAEAARTIGVHLRGGGKADEAQGASDEQLRKAQGLLQEALGPMAGRAKAIEHLEAAINQISAALKIR
jgi:hypothetical protein